MAVHGHPGVNAQVAEQLEAERHIELLPGTEIMTELAGTHFVHAHNAPDATVLVPQPSEHAHDPLNWTPLWKRLVVINQGIFVIFSVITGLSIAPLTPIYVEKWNKSLESVALLTGGIVISLGYANFIIIPCANVFGRRPTTLICSLIVIGTNIWQALATSYSSFLAARVCNGLGAAANESIMTVVVADIFFLHQRGKYVGVYFWCYFVGLFIGPIISGSVAEHTSWRWFFWACTIASGVNFITLFLLFPETRFLDRVQPQSSSSPTATSVETPPIEKTCSNAAEVEYPKANEAAIAIDRHLGHGSPSRRQFSLIQPIDRTAIQEILRHIVTPVQIFFFPIVFWASMSMGAAANALLCVNLTQSQVFAAPPYSFPPSSVGYVNFALVAGGVIGLGIAGPWSDWVAMRATRKNAGIREPEMRLPALLPFIAAACLGLTVVGVGYQQQWPWEAIVVIGFSLTGLQVVAIPTIAITYAIDCYRPIAGQIMVIATVCKNTFGFGMTYYINDWATEDGFVPPLMLLMAMTVGFTLAGVVIFCMSGKSVRRWTRDAKVHDF